MEIKKFRYNKSTPIEKANDLFMAFYCDACFRKLRVSSDKYGFGLVCPHCGEGLICPNPSFHMGEELGKYRIDGWLASGAMGEVYYAHGLNTNNIVALKVLNCEETTDLSLKIFENESFILSNINHPHIPRFSSSGVHDGKYRYLTMEYMEGECAEHILIRTDGLPEKILLSLIVQMAEILKFIWSNYGLLHRDIKPGNILITEDEQVILIDWGLAIRYDNKLLADPEQTLGTPHFICPKIVEGITNIDYRSDMYSLGATCYQLLTCQFPFFDEDLEKLIDKKLNLPAPDPADIVKDLLPETSSIVMKMMAKEYEDRYENWDQVIYEANQALQKLNQ